MIGFLKPYHGIIYLIGLAFVIAGLPLSKVAISTGVITLFANWIIEGNLKNKIGEFLKNKIAIAIASLYVLHLIGLFYSSDFSYAYKDLRTKIPMLILPVVIASSEKLDKNKFNYLLLIFVGACFISSLISMYFYLTMDFLDIRDICILVSHIRLSLMICLAVFILLYLIFSGNSSIRVNKIILSILALWFVYFLFVLESITGISIIIIIGFAFAVVGIFKLKVFYRVLIIASMIAVILLGGSYIYKINRNFSPAVLSNSGNPDDKTSRGNIYTHDTLNKETENGNYVWSYLCESELQEAWDTRSNLKYYGKDKKEQYIRYTLIRFLTSKGFRKDAEGISKLTDDEVHSIENGVANVCCQQKHSFSTRIYETLWEYKNYSTANPNGHSIMQRLEYWKASLGIIKENLFFGVGTGDMEIAFKEYYERTNSPLDEKLRLRSHNQFLSITVGFGLFGFLWFLSVLAFPFFSKWVRKDFIYITFFLIIILSMITEDTIESQAGLTFFVFFNSLFLSGRKHE